MRYASTLLLLSVVALAISAAVVYSQDDQEEFPQMDAVRAAIPRYEAAYQDLQELMGEYTAEREPLIARLSKIEASRRALKRLEHTAQERDALEAKFEEALLELSKFDSAWSSRLREQLEKCEELQSEVAPYGVPVEKLLTREEKDRIRKVDHPFVLIQQDDDQLQLERKHERILQRAGLDNMYAANLKLDALEGQVDLAKERAEAKRKEKADAEDALRKAVREKEAENVIVDLEAEVAAAESARKEAVEQSEAALDAYDEFRAEFLDHDRALAAASVSFQQIEISRAGYLMDYAGRDGVPDYFVSRDGIESVNDGDIASVENPEIVETAEIRFDNSGVIETVSEMTRLQDVKVDMWSLQKFTGDESIGETFGRCIDALVSLPELASVELEISSRMRPTDLAALARLNNLKRLKITYGNMTMPLMKNLGKMKSIDHLVLTGTIEADDWAKLGETLSGFGMVSLTSVPDAEDSGLLETACALPNLHSIKISASEENLSVVARSKSVQRLSIHGDLRGVEWELSGLDFGQLKTLTQLKELILVKTQITSKQLIELAALKNLEQLTLLECQLLDPTALEFFDQAQSLKRLDMRFCTGLPAWVEGVIRHRLPGCEVLPRGDLGYEP